MLQQRPPFPSGVMDCILPRDQNIGGLYLSGIEAALNPYLLQQNQIGAILTVGTEMANLQFTDADHKILHLNDTSHDPIKKYFDESIHFIDENRKKQCNVLVHCFVGVSRSATIIIAYLMQIYNFPLQKALSHLIQLRPLINPNPGFLQQLQYFDQELLRRRLTQLRPSSSQQQRFQSAHISKKEQLSSYRSMAVPDSPLRKVNAPGQTRQSLMMTPSSLRKDQQNMRQGTPLTLKENNFCKSLNSSINGEFTKVLQQCNQYHSAKKQSENSKMQQAAQFCKTYSNTQNKISQFNLFLKANGPGQTHQQRGRIPTKFKGTSQL